jgi:hypothetical protein
MKRFTMWAVQLGLAAAVLVLPAAARGQFLLVDCSGANPYAYPSINAALPAAGMWAYISVTGVCNESVFFYGANNLTLAGFPATLNGNLSINNSQNVYVYGFNITNAYGDGIDVNSSRSVVLDSCSSSGNAGNGLTASETSDVSINAFGTFDNNGGRGIFVGNNSYVSVNSWAGPTDISNNQTAALWIGQGNFSTGGNTHIANNAYAPNAGLRVAIDMRGGGKAQIGSFFGPNVIENNPNGAVSLQENAEVSFWSLPQFSGPNIIRNNGPFGIEAGFGSQVTLAGIQISGHTGPALDIYAHSQLYGTSVIPNLGAVQIQNNGTAGDPLGAAVRVDGNSQALLRGVTISQNNVPAILALVNSSADFTGMTFAGNPGVLTCDSSSVMVSDLSVLASTPGAGVRCTTAHTVGNRSVQFSIAAVPDATRWKAMHDKVLQRAATRK